ncbi:MAG TPA: Uma2 family endonuclease [Gemmataceae bacterium]|nr:Uma2 family endonuclease [Gemmataceae bacterium]
MSIAIAEKLLTAEEFAQLPDDGTPSELVRGRIVRMNMPRPRHGQICAQIVYLLRRHFEDKPVGHVVSNDSGVVTERGPDTVRGADVAFYSYGRVPPGPLPRGYLAVVPELVFEVRSPTDRWAAILAKVVEYLTAGVGVVCVLDEMTETVNLYTDDQPLRILRGDDVLELPDVLPGFQTPVRRFFA